MPGDAGEIDEDFDENWLGENEPKAACIDQFATGMASMKVQTKVDTNNMDDPPSTARSKRTPSIASSKRTVKIRKIGTKKDSE